MHKETTREDLKKMSRITGKTCVCFNLRKASRLLSLVYDQALKPTGIKATQFSLMMAVAGNRGIPIGKLARPLGMDRSTLSRNAKILENKGLLEIEEGEDRREQIFNLTEEGISLLQEAIPMWEGVQLELAEKMGNKRLTVLLNDLQDLVREAKL
ncbi:MarR family winged helix-turn-helix transcriptional regulator [Desulfosporosinus nitroreducens]|uniref:MarR family winged helix-turn-helix transcriptional regulator n=1 Tax=Desulfosporosinus nitroreducens TaxID=2018668 RepID=UPI00207CFAD4|nr:MarR family transcriptional regulator [Desulfosporosinus nitroreducens]MCO1602812.1 MarR family transcriptional regulator [Desulfosporosinus nitroreducens]